MKWLKSSDDPELFWIQNQLGELDLNQEVQSGFMSDREYVNIWSQLVDACSSCYGDAVSWVLVLPAAATLRLRDVPQRRPSGHRPSLQLPAALGARDSGLAPPPRRHWRLLLLVFIAAARPQPEPRYRPETQTGNTLKY